MIKGVNKKKGRRRKSQDRGYVEKHGKKENKKKKMTNDEKAAYHS